MKEVGDKARPAGKSFSGALAFGTPVELIKDRLYFHTIEGAPKSNATTHLFSVDNQVSYESFYNDFGPLNLAILFRYCEKVKEKLAASKKRLIHYTSLDPKKRVNSAFLAGCFAILHGGASPEVLWRRFLTSQEPPEFIGFRDAAMGPSTYDLHILDVWRGVKKAASLGWLNFRTFDVAEYEYYERVETGDFNWIVPDKFLAFCGPHAETVVKDGYPYHAPEVYFDYFRSHNVTTIIRLNKKIYEARRFTEAGFGHVDLFFVDGSTPSDAIVRRFLDAVDASPGACAVHCKAGLGRTGTLIGCWMMREFGLTAAEVMAWCRVCRPGSIIGPQQRWLISKQEWCWSMGKHASKAINGTAPAIGRKSEPAILAHRPPKHQRAKVAPQSNGLGGLATKVDDIRLASDRGVQPEPGSDETALTTEGLSQGDRLLAIKAAKAAKSPPPTPPHQLTRRPIHSTSSLALNPRYTSPTTPIKPMAALASRHSTAALRLHSPIREEKEPSASPSTRRLDFGGPRTNSLPRKVARVNGAEPRSGDSPSTSSVGQPPRMFRTRMSTSGLSAAKSDSPGTSAKKSTFTERPKALRKSASRAGLPPRGLASSGPGRSCLLKRPALPKAETALHPKTTTTVLNGVADVKTALGGAKAGLSSSKTASSLRAVGKPQLASAKTSAALHGGGKTARLARAATASGLQPYFLRSKRSRSPTEEPPARNPRKMHSQRSRDARLSNGI